MSSQSESLRRRSPLSAIAPGILVAATGVGAGDLATAGFAGARLGLAVCWAVVLGAGFKWALNEGLARWQLATGTTLLEGWRRRLHVHWIFLVYLVLWGYFVGRALISACGIAGLAIWPIFADDGTTRFFWGVVHSLAAVLLVWLGGFRLFERLMSACIALMFVAVTLSAVWILPQVDLSTMPAVSPLRLRGESLQWTLGLIGGVGGTVTLLSYGYWIREEGRSGRDGVRACRLDLSLGYAMTALFGLALIVIAAATPGITEKGPQLLVLLGDRIEGELGPAARALFLAGAWGAIFSSTLGVWQGIPYLFADFMSEVNVLRGARPGTYTSTWPYHAFLLYLALAPLATLGRPVEQIQLTYTILGALFMPFLAVTLLIMTNHRRWMPRDFRSGWAVNVLLVLTLAFFAWYGYREIGARIATLTTGSDG